MQRSLDQFDLSAAELDIVKRALTDAAARKPAKAARRGAKKSRPPVRARRPAAKKRGKVR